MLCFGWDIIVDISNLLNANDNGILAKQHLALAKQSEFWFMLWCGNSTNVIVFVSMQSAHFQICGWYLNNFRRLMVMPPTPLLGFFAAVVK